jgi:hypothetical protein
MHSCSSLPFLSISSLGVTPDSSSLSIPVSFSSSPSFSSFFPDYFFFLATTVGALLEKFLGNFYINSIVGDITEEMWNLLLVVGIISAASIGISA